MVAAVLLNFPKEDSAFILTFGHMVYWFGKSFLEVFNPFQERMNSKTPQTNENIEKIIDQFLLIIQVTILILKGHNDSKPQKKYFCLCTHLRVSFWVNKSRGIVFFKKFDLKSVWAKA